MASRKLDLYKLGVVVEVNGQKSLATLSQVEKQSNAVQTSFKGLRGQIGALTGALGKGDAGGDGLLGSIASGLQMLPGLGMIAGGLSKIAGVMQTGIKVGIEHNKLLDENMISYEKLLGTQSKAAAHVKTLAGLRASGIALPDALVGSKRLQAVGFEAREVVRVLTAIGDASRGTGADVDSVTRALAQMRAKGKVSAEEMNQQLGEQGINGWKFIAEEMARVDKKFARLAPDKQIAEIMKRAEKGLISGAAGVEAILRGIEREYGGTGRRWANETGSGLEFQTKELAAQTLGLASTGAYAGYKGLLRGSMATLGSETVQGIAIGIGDGTSYGVTAIHKLAADLVNAAKSPEGFDVNSPAKKFIPIGMSAGEGLIVGMEGFMQGPGLQRINRTIGRFTDEIEEEIEKNARRTGLDPDLIRSMMKQESGGRRGAVSHKGASGLMQLMPGTAKRFGVKNIFDPAENIRGGTDYMAWLMKRFGGDTRKALAGYNAGEGAVDKYRGIPPYRETQNYVRSIMGDYEKRRATSGVTSGSTLTGVSAPSDRRAFMRKVDEGLYYVSNTGEVFEIQTDWPSGTQGVGAPMQRRTKIGNVSDPYELSRGTGSMANAETLIKEYARRNMAFIDLSKPLPVVITAAPAGIGTGATRDTAEMTAATNLAAFKLRHADLPVSTEGGNILGLDAIAVKPIMMLPGALQDMSRAAKDALPPIKGLYQAESRLAQLRGALGNVAGLMPQQQVGKKRGFFSKLLGFASPFLGMIPGVGPLLSTLANMGSAAAGGDWGSVLTQGITGFSSGGAFRRSSGSGTQSVSFANGIPTPPTGTNQIINLPLLGRPPGRAQGGPVSRGRAYLVGEHRPEIVQFGDDGYVHPSIESFSRREAGGGSSGGGKGGSWNHMIERMLAALEQNTQATTQLHTRVESMPAGDMLAIGARQNPGAIGDGLMRAGSRDPKVVEWMRRRTA